MMNARIEEMNPKEWLQHTRAQYGLFDSTPFRLHRKWLEELLSRLPESGRQNARAVWESGDGRPSHEIYDELMDTYVKQIAPVIQKDEQEVFENTFFGILPTFEFNGYAGYTPKGDRIIILHEALGYTLNFWSHWYHRVHEEGNRYLTENPQRHFDTLKYILERWYGRPPTAELPDIYPRTSDSWLLSETMTLCAIAFVLGHELGHVLHGHQGYGFHRETNHDMEYEADSVGLSFAIRYALFRTAILKQDNYYTKFGLFSPLFALGVMSIFGDDATDTHPSLSSRGARLLAQYRSFFEDLFHDKSGKIWDDIDPDLQTILDGNNARIFDLFAIYRDILGDIDIQPPENDLSWLRESGKFRMS